MQVWPIPGFCLCARRWLPFSHFPHHHKNTLCLFGTTTMVTLKFVLNKSLRSWAQQSEAVAVSSSEHSWVHDLLTKARQKHLHMLLMSDGGQHTHTHTHASEEWMKLTRRHTPVRGLGNRSLPRVNLVKWGDVTMLNETICHTKNCTVATKMIGINILWFKVTI